MCRVDEVDMSSSTDPYGYWKVKGSLKPGYLTSQMKPKKIGELATYKVWLSDVIGKDVSDEVVQGLMHANPLKQNWLLFVYQSLFCSHSSNLC
jgi:hypothetical protein